ncbi:MAG: MFS transporter [Pedobacter sp.]|nr:MFS transporter [Pedobacter sp.]
MNDYKNNIRWLIWIAPFKDLPISTAFVVPFFLNSGLGQAQIFLLQSIFSVVFLLWNVPSGYLADRFGKALSIKIGAPVAAIAMTAYGFSDHFWQFALCEVGLAIGEGLINGADQALLIESLAKTKQSNSFVKISQRINALAFASTAISVPIAILLVTHVGLGATLTADGLLFFVAAILAWRLKEVMIKTDNTENADLSAWRALINFIKQPKIRWLLILTVSLGSGPYLAFWLTAPYYASLGIPLILFSVLLAIRSIWKAWISHKFHQNTGTRKSLIAYSMTNVTVFFGMATQQIWLIWIVLGHDVIESLQGPPIVEKINSFVSKQYRATLNSVVGISQRLIYVVIGPIIGLLVDKSGLRNGLIFAGATCSFVSLLAIARLAKLKIY